ncbi:pyrimidine dimer DNA glycosylase/endonuclease V [Pseudomonas sp. OIL-1]|uniref:pyrimidine dimer DNA glycosylase/endonuclease V n=1 Tax=Pseudomonas sp. OIL-1 TaxID=2706126 RepID=UPI0013A7A1BB|nr:pyrimidine dimer DNA glycosylase/endonuclease V [Pseudomonas sp. OIL-1]QIB51899.1 DNA lyase [Pseudomonas sp. OIL-1]
MRLWTLHPKYLDPKGLVALWREGLLARAVLHNQTRGYKQHPQLERFRAHPDPLAAIDAYLAAVLAEATSRGYRFDQSKIAPTLSVAPIAATTGQVECEWAHLMNKLLIRSPGLHAHWIETANPDCHPLFTLTPGPVASWERAPAVAVQVSNPFLKRLD